MDIKESFGFDKDLAVKGKWHNLPAGGRVRVAKLGNPSYTAEIIRLQKPVLTILRSSKIDNTGLIDSITINAMAKAILTDWSNISLDGEQIEYSFENAVHLLTEYPDFREVISELSIQSSNFKAEDLVEK